MLRNKIEEIFKQTISQAIAETELGELKETPEEIPIDFPKNPDHGDRAVSIAMKLTKAAKIPPREIAEKIVQKINQDLFTTVEIAGPGFINLKFNWELLNELINNIHIQDTNYGSFDPESRPDKSYSNINLEYVSANPTGDLHLGHARQAVLGSALGKLLNKAGYKVHHEFYLNDAGVQIKKLGLSCKQAIEVQEGIIDKTAYNEEENYPLDSMLEFITPEIYKSKFEDLDNLDIDICSEFAQKVFIEAQKSILRKIYTVFDTWYSEKQNLHQKPSNGEAKIESTLEALQQSGYSYESENALWFKAKEFGDERDRVLKKADGYYTYLAGDFAYHNDKFKRGFDRCINLWGADHHGQVPGMKGGLQALGYDPEALEIILIQMVSLTKGGKEVKMSKRDGNIVTLRELVKEVGVDAVRYYLIESQANNRIVFDLELAKKQDKDNPVYYIQYAHARCCSIIRNLTSPQINQEANTQEPAFVDATTFKQWQEDSKKDTSLFAKAFQDLNKEETSSTRNLILALANYPEEVKDAAQNRAPYKIANYLKHVAGLFHQFYTHNRVISDNLELSKARCCIVAATQITLKNALNLLDISAPERM